MFRPVLSHLQAVQDCKKKKYTTMYVILLKCRSKFCYTYYERKL